MSVIADISVSSGEFEVGRTMDFSSAGTVELESLVPVGERAIPCFWVYDADFEAFEAFVGERQAVEELQRVDSYDDRTLYAVTWSIEDDAVFQAARRAEAYVLEAVGADGAWEFELRFPSRDALSTFQKRCRQRGVSFEVRRIYNPTEPEVGPWFGLTEPQREALELAVRRGYYEIPRGCTTLELAEELGISDQAVTERLRRAITTLYSNTVIGSSES